ncbi:hypothetical protein [Micromonospora sp. CA-248212]|uniref:hypothetical protein n=1 Tax=Micromonospora sp. CA-248212 TaxID=3239961 RepID=UPI003D8D28E4
MQLTEMGYEAEPGHWKIQCRAGDHLGLLWDVTSTCLPTSPQVRTLFASGRSEHFEHAEEVSSLKDLVTVSPMGSALQMTEP